ncbi:hypothetical protein [Methylomonas sp. LWB]|uniref:hypothetical protein n=1 Tax=Methylomonas sp. LWB TaxID=1905845 RepID=UPI000A83E476|nr:hypothetical protein [Methylomonas sp. LWB]
MKTISWRIFLVLAVMLRVELAAADVKVFESLFARYQANIDQQFIRMIPEDADSPAILYKKYLDHRKAKALPGQAESVEYLIYDSRTGKSISLWEARAADKTVVGKIVKRDDGYLIPLLNGKDLKIFKYSPKQQKLESVSLKPFGVKAGNSVKQLFHISTGYIALVDAEKTSKLVFQAYDSDEQLSVDFAYLQLPIVGIEDVAEANDTIYIAAKAKKNLDETASFLFRVNNKFAADSVKVEGLDVDPRLAQHASFISTTHVQPSLQIVSRKRNPSPPSLYLYRVGEKAKLIWHFDFDEIEAGSHLQISGICHDNYLFARRTKPNGKISDTAEFRLLNAEGKELMTWTKQMMTNGSLVDVRPESIGQSVFLISNFSKLEDARRQDGWYSWMGLQIDRVPVSEVCSTNQKVN